MLSQTRQIRVRLYQSLDGVLFIAALLLAYHLRSAFSTWELPELEEVDKYLWLSPVVFVLGPLFMSGQKLYEETFDWTHKAAALGILKGASYLTFSLVVLLFLLRVQYARSVILMVGVLGGAFVYARYELSRWVDSSRHLALRRRVLWLGKSAELSVLRAKMSATESSYIESLPDIDPDQCTSERLSGLLHEHAVNLVVVSLAAADLNKISDLLLVCEREGVEVVLRPGLLTSSPYRLVSEVFAGEPVFLFRAQAASPNQLLAKQLIDYVGALALLIVLSPLLLLIAAAIRIGSSGPILYRQQRAGLNGKPFTLYKFRSMKRDAEMEKEALAKQNEMKGPVFKMRRDPRVTRLGGILRRHSMDELPQLWNVLKGEMSLVGPRPLPLEEVRRFEDDAHRRRLSVKPGLTCLWQISGRNDIADFKDWVRLDLAYIDQWSLWLDVKILIATIPVSLFGRGGR
jgi:exopolysaccharide biosynthesis polyprenyl glycosylphosphotransferase